MDYLPKQFIEESVEVQFTEPPVLEKKPTCPTSFVWRGRLFQIIETVAEWQDYRRRGRMARNMQPKHAMVAERRGSWGVGQFYFRVRTEDGRVFDLYYDRAPQDVDHRKGNWFLYQELKT